MTDVQLHLEALGKTALVVDSASKQVKAKQELLSLLIASEQTRLSVWLHPLENNKKHYFTSGHGKGGLPDVSSMSHLKMLVLTLIDCRHWSLENGLGRESCDRCASC
jgi:phosphatidylinositol 4-kinase